MRLRVLINFPMIVIACTGIIACSSAPATEGMHQTIAKGKNGALIVVTGPEYITGNVDKTKGFEFTTTLHVSGGPVKGIAEITPLSVPSSECALRREFTRHIELDNLGNGESTGTVHFAADVDCWFQYRVRLASRFTTKTDGHYALTAITDDMPLIVSFLRKLDWEKEKLIKHQAKKTCEMVALGKLAGQQVADFIWPRTAFKDLGLNNYHMEGDVVIEGVSYRIACSVSGAEGGWYVKELEIPGKT